jgi:hypothetical protein
MLGSASLCVLLGIAAPPLELRLVMIDFVRIAPQVSGGMIEEARRLLGPKGVGLLTRQGTAAEQRLPGEVGVLLLSERSRGKSRGGQRLGAIQTTAGVTTIWIDVPAVASVAEANRGLHCCSAEMRRLGLALGRVLTHELVHLLDPALAHTRNGLMAARVDRATLVDDPAPDTPLRIVKRPNSDLDN